jgi:hypothetical protein
MPQNPLQPVASETSIVPSRRWLLGITIVDWTMEQPIDFKLPARRLPRFLLEQLDGLSKQTQMHPIIHWLEIGKCPRKASCAGLYKLDKHQRNLFSCKIRIIFAPMKQPGSFIRNLVNT